MSKRVGTGIVVAVLVAAFVLPMSVAAAGPGAGNMAGQGLRTQSQTRSMDQLRTTDQIRIQQRLHDGTGLNTTAVPSGAMTSGGKAYGPGDGTGNMGIGPKDGTGFGAPANR
jgi:hypothetical protein